MSWILESWLNRLIFQLCENSVDGYACKVRRGEFLLLLYASVATVSLIASLNLDLCRIRSGSIVEFDMGLQSCRGMLQSDRRTDYLIQWVLRQKGLRTCRKQPCLLSKHQIHDSSNIHCILYFARTRPPSQVDVCFAPILPGAGAKRNMAAKDSHTSCVALSFLVDMIQVLLVMCHENMLKVVELRACGKGSRVPSYSRGKLRSLNQLGKPTIPLLILHTHFFIIHSEVII